MMSISKIDFSKQQLIIAFQQGKMLGDDVMIGLLITQPGELITLEELNVFFEEGNPSYFIAEPLPEALQNLAVDVEVSSGVIQQALVEIVNEYREHDFDKIHKRNVIYIVDPKIVH